MRTVMRRIRDTKWPDQRLSDRVLHSRLISNTGTGSHGIERDALDKLERLVGANHQQEHGHVLHLQVEKQPAAG